MRLERKDGDRPSGWSSPWIGLILIAGVYLLFVGAYSAINPIFEAPDEYHHFFAIKTIVDYGQLPSTQDGISYLAGQESAQPPLYYLLAGLLLKSADLTGADEELWFNPSVRIGDTSRYRNKNVFVHAPNEEWPWKGYVLAVHKVRLFSALLGLGTLLLIYGSARLIWPNRLVAAYVAAMLAAVLPQFAFLHASISNDPLIIFLSTFTLWQLLRIWFTGMTYLRVVFLGVTVGLAILSKNTGLLLFFYVFVFIAAAVWRSSQRSSPFSIKRIAISECLFAAAAAAISSWLLWRNWALYGDVTATNEFIRLAGGDKGFTFWQVVKNSLSMRESMFGTFGWLNVASPEWVYWIWSGLILLAVVMLVMHLIRGRSGLKHQDEGRPSRVWPSLAVLLGLWVLLVYAGLLLFMLRTPAAQGRLLFPAIAPVVMAVAFGLSLIRPRWLLAIPLLLVSFTSIYDVIQVIPDAYRRPPVISITDIPPDADRIDTDLGKGLNLMAGQVETKEVLPGDLVWLTLYWQAEPDAEHFPSRGSPTYVVELLGRGDELVGKDQGYQGSGTLPAELWPSEGVVADRFSIPVVTEAHAPARIRINVKLAGEQRSVDAGFLKIAPHAWPARSEVVEAQFSGIELVWAIPKVTAASAGETVEIKVRWQVQESPERDLTTFIHLGNESVEPLAQGDSPPLSGHYPTSMWSVGEVIDDAYYLSIPKGIPPGRYPIRMGLYDSKEGTRIPLSINGQLQPESSFLIGWLDLIEDSESNN